MDVRTMQGLQRRILITIAVACTATSASAQYLDEPVSFRQDRLLPTLRTSERFKRAQMPARLLRPAVFSESGAAYIKLHFERLDLPEGVYVEISNPEGTESWRYSSDERDGFTLDRNSGDDGLNTFWSMSVSGDTAVVRLAGKLRNFDPMRHGFEIDRHYADIIETADDVVKTKASNPVSGLESNCGESELYDSICWAESYPDHYERTSPVALIITATGKKCTAWRVSDDNRMFTARHCISSQDQLDGAEVWFNYESTVCGSEAPTDPVKVTGGELLLENYDLDFALFTVDYFPRISEFGNMGLDVRDGEIGEEIFIPQHGLGNPKQLAIESDMNSGGLCAIDSTDVSGYSMGSDIGYMCDTTTSSSGSPVISGETGRVIALHHLGGCMNSGAKMTLIWPLVQDFFDGVPEGDADGKWKSPNQLPTARIATACNGLICELDASGSEDSDGSIVTYEWMVGDSFFSGPVIGHEFAEGGDYEVTLAVTDDEGATDVVDKIVSVSAPNQAPEARFSTSCIENRCSFNASGSSDPDGALTGWNWDFGDGTSASGQSVDHEYDSAGEFNVKLTIEDDDGETDQANYTVSVTLPNEAPRAAFTVSCDELSCTLDATASSDADGEIVDWSWDFGDGSSATGETVQHAYVDEGHYTIVLNVIDDDQAGDQGSRDVTVEKTPSNESPEALFSYSCDELSCSFDGSASNDTDGAIGSWTWNFGDGSVANGSSVSHAFNVAGEYTVSLTVSDGDGASDTVQHNISVEKPAEGPVANFSVSCNELDCVLDAGSTTASVSPAPSYDWSFGDGTTATGGAVQHQYTNDGIYTVTLKVTDGNGSSATTKTVKVQRDEQDELVLLAATDLSKDFPTVDLNWTGAETGLELYRNGQRIAAVNAKGSYSDKALKGEGPTVAYSVCESDSGRCSNIVKLTLGKI